MALIQSAGFPKLLDRGQAVNQPVTIFVQANQPFIIREPPSRNGARCIGPIRRSIGQMVSFKRPLSTTAPFTLTSRSTADGFGGLFPDLSLRETHGISCCPPQIFMPVGLKSPRSR